MAARPATTECGFGSVASDVQLQDIDPATQNVAWEACNGTYSKSNLDDGSYLMMARVQNTRRKLLATPAETYALSLFTVDTTPPVVQVSSGPPLYTSSSTAEFVFSSDDPNTTFTCALVPGTTSTPPGNGTANSGNFTVCSSPYVANNLPDGWHTWWLSATDVANNVARPTNRTFLVDTQPPSVTLQCPGASPSPSFNISWNTNDGNGSGIASTQCRFYPVVLRNGTTGSADGLPWTNCSSPMAFSNMPEGRYALQVMVTDRANVSAQASQCSVAVDATPPNTTIASGPDKNDLQPPQVTFVLVGDDGAWGSNVTLYQCQLNKISDADYQQLRDAAMTNVQLASSSWFNCSSTTVLDPSQLSTGTFAFRARAVDAAGNVGVPTAPWAFRVDSSIPIPSASASASSGKTFMMMMGVVVLFGVVVVIVDVVVIFAIAHAIMAFVCTDSALSLPIIIAIAVGAAAAALLLVAVLYSCYARRRRQAAPDPGAPPPVDPALEAAIAASLMDSGAYGGPPGGAPYAVGPAAPYGPAPYAPTAYTGPTGYTGPTAYTGPTPYGPTPHTPAPVPYAVPPAPYAPVHERGPDDAALEAAIQVLQQVAW